MKQNLNMTFVFLLAYLIFLENNNKIKWKNPICSFHLYSMDFDILRMSSSHIDVVIALGVCDWAPFFISYCILWLHIVNLMPD